MATARFEEKKRREFCRVLTPGLQLPAGRVPLEIKSGPGTTSTSPEAPVRTGSDLQSVHFNSRGRTTFRTVKG